ncbi:spore protease YyaC [Alkalihalobacillus pseudalcaliphilus]|uniref:spore protease YyaC n=1 Tax=Alkalihalobacillus pseudalcaliphilus TaxID=79884 RepID=UPI00064D9F2F|nr:spore protease YyaC [Alkalihalobacillus pseudalcaliphilus]KMK77906.1 hypothetical protein AB990_00100 [Alkalihalobacillus pseudalcaliphilus]
MSTNYRLFSKKTNPFRKHMDEPTITDDLATALYEYLPDKTSIPTVIVCIGTDRSTGDSLGPIIGSNLESLNLENFHVFGTLKDPVHAVNLLEKINLIEQTFEQPFIIAIDACLGKTKSIGDITVAKGPVSPGAAVKKELPAVGDIHLTGIVNVGGMMEYFVLQNTRLYTVMTMADIISRAFYQVDKKLSESKPYSVTPLAFSNRKSPFSNAFAFMKTDKFKL